MQLGDGRVLGICLCGFHGYAPVRGFVVFTSYAGWQVLVLWFFYTPYTITHMGGLCFVEFLVPWITKDHGSALEC